MKDDDFPSPNAQIKSFESADDLVAPLGGVGGNPNSDRLRYFGASSQRSTAPSYGTVDPQHLTPTLERSSSSESAGASSTIDYSPSPTESSFPRRSVLGQFTALVCHPHFSPQTLIPKYTAQSAGGAGSIYAAASDVGEQQQVETFTIYPPEPCTKTQSLDCS